MPLFSRRYFSSCHAVVPAKVDQYFGSKSSHHDLSRIRYWKETGKVVIPIPAILKSQDQAYTMIGREQNCYLFGQCQLIVVLYESLLVMKWQDAIRSIMILLVALTTDEWQNPLLRWVPERYCWLLGQGNWQYRRKRCWSWRRIVIYQMCFCIAISCCQRAMKRLRAGMGYVQSLRQFYRSNLWYRYAHVTFEPCSKSSSFRLWMLHCFHICIHHTRVALLLDK